MRRAAFNLAEQVGRPAPTSYLNRNIHPDRALLTRSVPFVQLDRLKARLRVRLNDVVLAIASGVLRRHGALCEEDVVPLRAMVPVNVRGEDGGAGNRIVFGFVELPLTERDPIARVDHIRAQTKRLKHSEHLSGSEALIASIGQLPRPIKVRAARIAAGPRVFNLTISNVPGPRMPLYVAGARATSIYPVIPLSEGHALAIGVLSYADQLHFALHADPRSVDESAEFPTLIDAAISELEAAARARHAPPRPGVGDSSDQVERRSDSGPVRPHRDRDRVEQRHRAERGAGTGASGRAGGARMPQRREG
jgi:WS/DGAT/MGAT family acyltransferase